MNYFTASAFGMVVLLSSSLTAKNAAAGEYEELLRLANAIESRTANAYYQDPNAFTYERAVRALYLQWYVEVGLPNGYADLCFIRNWFAIIRDGNNPSSNPNYFLEWLIRQGAANAIDLIDANHGCP